MRKQRENQKRAQKQGVEAWLKLKLNSLVIG
jgi:hypothetical protein